MSAWSPEIWKSREKGGKQLFPLNLDEILYFAVSILGAIAAPNSSAAFIKIEIKKTREAAPALWRAAVMAQHGRAGEVIIWDSKDPPPEKKVEGGKTT